MNRDNTAGTPLTMTDKEEASAKQNEQETSG